MADVIKDRYNISWWSFAVMTLGMNYLAIRLAIPRELDVPVLKFDSVFDLSDNFCVQGCVYLARV